MSTVVMVYLDMLSWDLILESTSQNREIQKDLLLYMMYNDIALISSWFQKWMLRSKNLRLKYMMRFCRKKFIQSQTISW